MGEKAGRMKKLLCVLFLATGLTMAQEPGPLPLRDDLYKCTSTTGPEFTMHYKRFPAEIQTEINQPIGNGDTTVPVIASVIVSGSGSVLTNIGRIVATSNGVPFTVSAADNVGITSASLYVDGKIATAVADPQGLPGLFYLRWNAKTVTPGKHMFSLVVWDAAGNVAERGWSMGA